MKIRQILSVALSAALMIVSIPLLFTAGSEPEVVTDSLNDFSKIADHNLPVISWFQADGGSKQGEDQAIMIQNHVFDQLAKNGVLDILPYLTWNVNGGAKIEFVAYLWEPFKDLTFSWSDGGEFREIPAAQIQKIDLATAQDLETYNLTAEKIDLTNPGNIARLYVIDALDISARQIRVTWPAVDGSWKAAPSMIRATGGTKHANLTFDTEHIMSNNKTADTAGMVRYTEAFSFDQKPGGLEALMVEWGYLAGKATVENPYVVYKAAPGKPFHARFVAHESYSKMGKPVKLYASADMQSWTEVPTLRTRDPIASDINMTLMNFWIVSVPEGKPYIKIEYPYDGDFSGKPWGAGYPGSADGPLTYMISLRSVRYTKYVVTDVEADTEHRIASGEAPNAAFWSDYSKGIFDWDETLNGERPYLILDYVAILGKTELPPVYVTYKVKGGSPILVEGVRHEKFAGLNLDFAFFTSANGSDWQPLEMSISQTDGPPGFKNRVYIAESIPAEHKFFKIVWPNEKDYTGTVIPSTGETIGDPVTYGIGLLTVKYNKSDEVDGFVNVPFTGNKAEDVKAWTDYTEAMFDFDQKMNDTPFLSLAYGAVADKTELPEAYVVYKVAEGSPFVLRSIIHDKSKNLGLRFKLLSSADGTAWTEIPDVEYAVTPAGNAWNSEIFRVAAVPAGHKYVKVLWPNEKDYTGTEDPVTGEVYGDPLHYSPGLLGASFIPGEPEADPGEEPAEDDPRSIRGDTTVTFAGDKDEDAAKMAGYHKEGVDFSQVLQIGMDNINVLMLSDNFAAGKDKLPEVYVSYAVKGGSPVRFEAYTDSAAREAELHFKLFWSADGKNWTQAETLYLAEETESEGWFKETYGTQALPAEAKYLKIVWPHEKDYSLDNGENMLNYAPALSLVSFNAAKIDTPSKPDNGDPGDVKTGSLPQTLALACALASLTLLALTRKRENHR